MASYLDFEKSIKQIDEDITAAKIRGDEDAVEILNKNLEKEISKVYKKYRRFGLWCVVSTVVNHFIWNSPFYETEHRINLVVGALFAFLAATFVEVYRLGIKEHNLS